MNNFQSRKTPTIAARILSVLELRPGMKIALKPTGHTLPESPAAALTGPVGVVRRVTPYGRSEVRVVVSHAYARHPSGAQAFVTSGTATAVALLPETKPVKYTPMALVAA